MEEWRLNSGPGPTKNDQKNAPMHPWAAHLFHNISPVPNVFETKTSRIQGSFFLITIFFTNPKLHALLKKDRKSLKKIHQKHLAHQLWGPPQHLRNPWNSLGKNQPETPMETGEMFLDPGNVCPKTQVTELKLEPILHVLRGKGGKLDTPNVYICKYAKWRKCAMYILTLPTTY